MKLFVVLGVVAIIALSNGEKCEEGTYLYTTDCGPIFLEPTCDTPKGQTMEDVKICDYSSCFCNPPTVREVVSNKCVTLDKCPKTDFQAWFEWRDQMKKEEAAQKQ